MNFNKETGVFPSGNKRFSGMPFIGDNYGLCTPKILIVGEDVGSDECVNDNIKDIDGNPLYYHDFLSKQLSCVSLKNKYNAHLVGTYMTAFYLLKNNERFDYMCEGSMCAKTAHKALKMLGTTAVLWIANVIAMTNLHKFVTVNRKDKSGAEDHECLDRDKEFGIFIEEVKCFAPDIVILQAINSISEKEVEQIKQAVKGVAVYKLKHPSNRQRGGVSYRI